MWNSQIHFTNLIYQVSVSCSMWDLGYPGVGLAALYSEKPSRKKLLRAKKFANFFG